MSIPCGNGHRHDTVAQVRSCYTTRYAQAKPVAAPEMPKPTHLDCTKIPEGRYALEIRGKIHFFRVVVGTGKWAGHRFVTESFGSPGAWREQKLLNTAQRATMRRILCDTLDDLVIQAEGPKAGAARFGKYFTRCARCSSPLSDKESRDRGLGPDCVQHYG